MQESNIAFNVCKKMNCNDRIYLFNEYLKKYKLIINIYILLYYNNLLNIY